MRKPTMSHIQ